MLMRRRACGESLAPQTRPVMRPEVFGDRMEGARQSPMAGMANPLARSLPSTADIPASPRTHIFLTDRLESESL